MKKRKEFTVRVFVLVDGKEVEADLKDTKLSDRCKLAIAEMITGQKHELVSDS